MVRFEFQKNESKTKQNMEIDKKRKRRISANFAQYTCFLQKLSKFGKFPMAENSRFCYAFPIGSKKHPGTQIHMGGKVHERIDDIKKIRIGKSL